MPRLSIRSRSLQAAATELTEALGKLQFGDPVTHVYNPLEYARKSHFEYLRLAPASKTDVVFLGMNPGPWGMAQTGVPFGEIEHVRRFLKISSSVEKPPLEHPKRPIEGFECQRSEVSGRRLWGLFEELFPNRQDFFRNNFVGNYCPLVFMEASGKNRTPDKLPAQEREPLHEVCDEHLARFLEILKPRVAVGIGAYAETCLHRCIDRMTIRPKTPITVTRILHPSPASPAANRDWAGTVTGQLRQAEIWTDRLGTV